MTRNGVNQCLARLDVVYPHHFKRDGIDARFALEVYHEILDDVDDSLLMAATKHWLSTARPFHPAPGELRDLALSLVTRSELSADEAWIEVFDAIRSVGSWNIPQWSSERIAQTVKAFGWRELCMTDIDQMSFVRAQFLKIYEAQARREHDVRLMLPDTRSRVAALIGETAKRLSAGTR